MKTFDAIIVDDEQSARDILSNLLSNYCPNISIVAKCENIVQAVESINKLKPKLVFLDIEMPNYAGYEITSFFDKIDFEIIFITAYDNYAINAFELSAVDYLLKPIDIDKLQKAVNKFETKSTKNDAFLKYKVLKESLKTDTIHKIVIPFQGYQKVLMLKDIIAFEANESYCYIHTANNKYLISKNLKKIETMLKSCPNIIRTHKSWMINTDYMINYSKAKMIINLKADITAKLSRVKKAEFEKLILN